MAKIDDYEIRGVSREIGDFVEDITTLLNKGKYAHSFLKTAPTWTARDGEAVVFKSGNTRRFYLYLNNEWNSIEFNSQLINSWLVFSGTGTVTVLDSVNVSSLTRNSEGDYTVSWDSDYLDPHYVVAQGGRGIINAGTDKAVVLAIDFRDGNPATDTLRFLCRIWDPLLEVDVDPHLASIMVLGD